MVGKNFERHIKSEQKEIAHVQNLAFFENPQFLSNPYENDYQKRQSFSPSFMRIGQKL